MMEKVILLLVVLIGLTLSSASPSIQGKAEKKVMVCYWGAWAAYRNGQCKFDVDNIDPNLCTHLIYAFTGLNETSSEIIPVDPYFDLCPDEYSGCGYKRFVALKEQNPELKTLVAFGGWDDGGSGKYSKLAADPAKRRTFTQSVVDFLLLHGFDGLDYDWEYPAAYPGGQPEDKENFILMLSELKAAFAPLNLLLTAALSPGRATADAAYDIPAMSSILDHLHVMAYDYHGTWESFTGQNSPMYVNPDIDTGKYAEYSVDFTINYYLTKGAPANKLVLLMPLYGRGWILDGGSSIGYYEPANRPISPGSCTYQSGQWGYNELCLNLEKPDETWTIVRDNVYYQAPYAHSDKRSWIGYDDPMSLTLKAEYAVANGLLGGGVWSLDTDDFNGDCKSSNNEPFVLTKAIVKALSSGN